MRRFAMMALALIVVGTPARAQDPVSIIVFGSVRNASGVPVKGAEVWLDGTASRTVSNDSGEFRIDNAPSGRFKLRVRRIGFFPDDKKVSLAAGDTRQVKFVLDG